MVKPKCTFLMFHFHCSGNECQNWLYACKNSCDGVIFTVVVTHVWTGCMHVGNHCDGITFTVVMCNFPCGSNRCLNWLCACRNCCDGVTFTVIVIMM